MKVTDLNRQSRLNTECFNLKVALNSPLGLNFDGFVKTYIDRRMQDDDGFSFIDKLMSLDKVDEAVCSLENVVSVIDGCYQSGCTPMWFERLDNAIINYIQQQYSSSEENELKDFIYRLQNNKLKAFEIMRNSGLMRYLTNHS